MEWGGIVVQLAFAQTTTVTIWRIKKHLECSVFAPYSVTIFQGLWAWVSLVSSIFQIWSDWRLFASKTLPNARQYLSIFVISECNHDRVSLFNRGRTISLYISMKSWHSHQHFGTKFVINKRVIISILIFFSATKLTCLMRGFLDPYSCSHQEVC
jgi:hypothetical protein